MMSLSIVLYKSDNFTLLTNFVRGNEVEAEFRHLTLSRLITIYQLYTCKCQKQNIAGFWSHAFCLSAENLSFRFVKKNAVNWF